ncbi:DUF935 family protein, partial [bacterium]|nr:DUF935 family protein [bacterium]
YQVSACIESRKAGTLSCNWELKENNCKNFKFYDELFNCLDVHRLIEDILDAPMYGYVPIEISWQKEGSNLIPSCLSAKPQEWFFFDSEGEFFFKDKNYKGKREINLSGVKFLLPRNKPTYKNPYGKAKLSSAFWNVAFINGGMEFWIKFSEKYAMPYMFGKYDRSLSKVEQRDFLQGLKNLVQDAVALIPSDGSVEIMQTGSTSNSAIYSDLITKCENNISKAILGQTLTTDIGSLGSYAASTTHMGVREDIVESDKKLVENTINQFIRMIDTLNFRDNNLPEFKFVDETDLSALAERDNTVAALGIKFTKEYIKKTYGYEEDDIEIVSNSAFEYEDNHKAVEIHMPESEDFDFNTNPLNKNLNKIAQYFENSKDYEGALNQLEDLYPQFSSEKLEKILTKLIFISELQGRLEAQQVEGGKLKVKNVK